MSFGGVWFAKIGWYYENMRPSSTQGFTLIEMIVAIGLASIVLTALLSFFTAFIGHQARVQDERIALETVRFFFSELSRETYFGYDYTCGQDVGGECRCLAFTDQSGKRVKVWYDSTNKQVKRAVKLFDANPNVCSSADGWVPFTDNAVSVTKLAFELESNATKQPRIQAQIDAEYVVDNNTERVSFKTQITNRILEPNQNVLNTFVAGSESENTAVIHHYAYGPRINGSGQYLGKGSTVVTDAKDAEVVCRDGAGNVFLDSFCEKSVQITMVEMTSDGLYILGNNGLLFFMPQASIDDALKASGGVNGGNPVYKVSSDIQNTIVRVLGKRFGSTNCRFCANDPRSITSIHTAGNYLYARSYNGALYRVENTSAVRIMAGGVNKNTVRRIDSNANRVLVYFRDAVGNRTVRLFSGDSSISTSDIIGGCSEFAYVPRDSMSSRCRQLYPDPNINNGVAITPNDISSISFRFLDALQVINDTISLWYRDGTGKHVVSVGQGATKLKRSDAIADSSTFVYGNGLNKYTAICSGGTGLCAMNTITDATPTMVTTSNASPLIDHLHFKGLPIAINENGRLVYFSGVAASDTTTEISVYNKNGTVENTQRILCDTTILNNQQVVLKTLSSRHPNKDIVAATGRSLITGYVDEVYLLEPTTTTKEQYAGTELNIVCSDTDHIERYHLPKTTGPAGGLDILRLHGVEFWEKKPAKP